MDLGSAMTIAKAAGDKAGAGVQLIGGLVGMYHAQRARKAGKEKLAEIEELIRSVLPPNIELDVNKLVNAPEVLLDEVKLEGPEFDAIAPQKYAMIAEYMPEAIPVIAEVSPQLVKQTEQGKMGRDAQLDSLQELRRVGRAGADDPIAQAATQRALREAQMAAQSRQASIVQDMQRRGMADSGLTIAAQLQGQSDAMERAAMLGQQASSDAYARSLQAMRDAGRAGRELQQDEFSQEQANTNIINDFNQRMSARSQNVAAQNTDIRNTGKLRNVNTAQGIADKNAQLDFDTQRYNQGFGMDKAKFRAGEQSRVAQGRQNDFENKMRVQNDYRDRQQDDYANRSGYTANIAGAKSGQYQDVINRGKGTAQNIKSITDAAAAYAANGKYQKAAQQDNPGPMPQDDDDQLYDDESAPWGGNYA